ncbi:MAG: ATP-binding protein, partial [Myxococcales bacterium]
GRSDHDHQMMSLSSQIMGAPRPTSIAVSASAAAAGVPNRSQADLLRTVKMLMLFRVGLATLLLASAVVAELSRGTVEELAGPFARFGFGLIAATYFASLAYALLFPRVRDPIRFAYWQIAIDLVLTTMVVHATGGAQSGFCFLYLIDVVAVALLARRRGAAVVAGAGITLMVGVAVLGWTHLLPLLPGQLVAPWHLSRGELAGKLTLNTAALIAVGFLASKLAAKNRQADERLTIHEAYAGDLARLHENTIRCLTSGLVTVDLAGRVTTANEVAREILGAGVRGLLGLPLTDVLPDLPRVLAAAGPAGTVRRAELSAATSDGSLRHLGVSAAPLSDHLGQLIGRVIHFQDLTELKRMELAVARSERLASIGRLSAAIAHEIRNPLASISGSMEILRDQPGTDPESRQLMNIAVREVDRLNALVTSLLDYARPSSEERRRIDLVEETREIVQAFERERRDERQPIAVEFETGSEAEIEAAGGQIRQILWNLLRNAAEAMPRGGTIKVQVTSAAESARRDRALSAPAGLPTPVTVTVADSGSGIPKGDLDRIFEPFFSTKAAGTGLGLATVARIVDDHHGAIEVTSAVGIGTTVTIRLPKATKAARSSLEHAA